MGREVRRVPKDWVHPRDGFYGDGTKKYRPLLTGYSDDVKRWDEAHAQWQKGLKRDYATDGWKPLDADDAKTTFSEFYGERPRKRDYMPEWTPEEATHLMMYETTTEGSPISPAFETPEQLARWLTDNSASAFGPVTATYEQWLATCRDGWAPDLIKVGSGPLITGVEHSASRGDKS